MEFFDKLVVYSAILILSLLSFALGLKGILKKKPFVISERWICLPLFISLLSQLIRTTIPLFINNKSLTNLDFTLCLSMYAIAISLFLKVFFLLSGYIVFGITKESFSKALKASSLSVNNLPSMISIGEKYPILVEIRIYENLGFGSFRTCHLHRARMKEVADMMNVFFSSTTNAYNMNLCYLSIVSGILFIIIFLSIFLFS
jgi:hypothetical protein